MMSPGSSHRAHSSGVSHLLASEIVNHNDWLTSVCAADSVIPIGSAIVFVFCERDERKALKPSYSRIDVIVAIGIDETQDALPLQSQCIAARELDRAGRRYASGNRRINPTARIVLDTLNLSVGDVPVTEYAAQGLRKPDQAIVVLLRDIQKVSEPVTLNVNSLSSNLASLARRSGLDCA